MEKYIFKLYVIKDTYSSKELVEKLSKVLKNELGDNYSLSVIDILQQPEQAVLDKVLATPTLILEMPLPQKRIVGNLTNVDSVLTALNLLK